MARRIFAGGAVVPSLLLPAVEADVRLELRDEQCELRERYEGDERASLHGITSFHLEAEVLERFGCSPILARSRRLIAAPHREIALSDPGGGEMAGG